MSHAPQPGHALLAVALALAACSGKHAPGGTAITVDGVAVLTVRAAHVHGRIALATLLPEAQRDGWRAIHATAGKRRLQLDPFADYAGLDIVLEVVHGAITLSGYRPVPPGASAAVIAELAEPRVSLAGVDAIDVVRAEHPADVPAIAFAPFHVTVGGTSKDVGPADLAGVAMADAKGGKAQGWQLVDVLAVVGPGPYTEVVITGDVTVTLDAAKLHDDVAVLRPNKKGLVVLDVFHGEDRTDHARDVTTITAR